MAKYRIVPYAINGGFVRMLVDERDFATIDIECDILCGACCLEWKLVKSLVAEFPNSSSKECPHLKNKSCELSRNKRPIECNCSLCDVAVSKMAEQILEKIEVKFRDGDKEKFELIF